MPHVLKREGGYVDDPTDRGGETKYGISKRSYPQLDIKNLTLDQALEIYRKDYWNPSRVEKLPDGLRDDYFDAVVNHGQGNAVKILQKAVNSTRGSKIAVDGKIGRNTIRESKRINKERFKAFRTLFYSAIVFKDESQERFYFGWWKRAVGVD